MLPKPARETDMTTDVKSLVAAAILVLAAYPGAALGQVYGTNDDPYQQNPFASNMTLPEPAPAAPATPTPPPDPGKTQQAAAATASSSDSATNAPPKKPPQP
jgi:hypothetical protein